MEKPENIKRISHQNNFEECYLRHQYLRRIKHNPTQEEMAPYNKIVENIAKNNFFTYKNLFLMVGLDLEDVVNIAQIHLISYLGLFALEINPEKLETFVRIFESNNSIKPSKEDLLNKNKANFTCFLKQRLEDVIRVCKQKAKNIKGLSAEEYLVFTGTKRPPKDIEDLLENHDKYGYHPLGNQAFKTIKKRMNNKQEGPVYLEKGTWYVCIPIRKKMLTLNDFACNDYNPYDNIHNMNPEQVAEKKEEDNKWENAWEEFSKKSTRVRGEILEDFIKENKKNKELKQEVKLARKFLESLDGSSI